MPASLRAAFAQQKKKELSSNKKRQRSRSDSTSSCDINPKRRKTAVSSSDDSSDDSSSEDESLGLSTVAGSTTAVNLDDSSSDDSSSDDSSSDDSSSDDSSSDDDMPVVATKQVNALPAKADRLDANGNPHVDCFGLSKETKRRLAEKNITSLFPIQAQTFEIVRAGKDVIGRARTGQGKTLAFSLPVIERLLAAPCQRNKRGRAPRVIIMAPTRELAKQVGNDFAWVAPSLDCVCVYGGTGFNEQNRAFWKGVDVVIGTPGRIIDHIERKNLNMSKIEYFVLDEADRMLDMGFQEDMDKVLSAVDVFFLKYLSKINEQQRSAQNVKPRQTLLFSATLPKWVKDMASRYMVNGYEIVDLVENQEEKASTDVDHFSLCAPWQMRSAIVSDLLQVYAAKETSRVIVFCQTKKDCNELIVSPDMKLPCRCIHGDIPQNQRESNLKAFRQGIFRVLVATDVAARGIHIDNIDLVINCEPPSNGRPGHSRHVDTDTYVHRSGRTGRAGRHGTCITMYSHSQLPFIQKIEKAIGNKLKRIGPPQPKQLIHVAAKEAASRVRALPTQVESYFSEAAKELIDSIGPEAALARALASISGHTGEIKGRSLLSSNSDFTTFMFSTGGRTKIETLSYVWTALRNRIGAEICNDIRGLTLTKESTSAVFDVPHKHLSVVRKAAEHDTVGKVQIIEIDELPDLKPRPSTGGYNSRNGRGGGRGGRRGGGRFGNRGGSGGGRGGRSGGRGRGRGGRSGGRSRGRW